MKRDIELIKEILTALEESDNDLPNVNFNLHGRSDLEVSYHVKLLMQAGLIEAENVSGTNLYK